MVACRWHSVKGGRGASTRSGDFWWYGKGPSDQHMYIARCADRFDLKQRGLNLGRHLVFLGPKDVNEMILTQEFAHIHLHSRMSVQDVFHQRIPAWFDEGLATHLFRNPRVQSFTPRQAIWIKQAQSFREWGRLHQTRDWQETYGAAKALVVALHAEIGDAGLRTIIDDALESGDFEAALRPGLAMTGLDAIARLDHHDTHENIQNLSPR